jgi:hypothetical protein
MKPLGIEIALHYHCSAAEFPRLNAPACMEMCQFFVGHGLLRDGEEGGRRFEPTNGLKFYIEALLKTPLPRKVWVMPPFVGLEEAEAFP